MTTKNTKAQKAQTVTIWQTAAVEIAGAGVRLSTYLLAAVSAAFAQEIVTHDGERAKGGSKVVELLTEAAKAAGVTLPSELKGQVSKVAKVIGTNVHGAGDLVKASDDAARIAACGAWVAQHGSPLVAAGKGASDSGDTWEKLLGSCATRANALNGDDRGVEELVARLFRAMKDGERERMIVRLSRVDGRVRPMA